MNKVKIMLTAMIIIGTVGGVLAFKSKRIVRYCTAAAPSGTCTTVKCPNGALMDADGGTTDKCFKTTAVTANCASDNQDCTGKGRISGN